MVLKKKKDETPPQVALLIPWVWVYHKKNILKHYLKSVQHTSSYGRYTNIAETKHEMRFYFKTLQPILVLSETHQINENIFYISLCQGLKSTKEDCIYTKNNRGKQSQ